MKDVELTVTLPTGEVSVTYHSNRSGAKRYLGRLQKKYNLKKMKRTIIALALLIGLAFPGFSQMSIIGNLTIPTEAMLDGIVLHYDGVSLQAQFMDPPNTAFKACIEIRKYTTNTPITQEVIEKRRTYTYELEPRARFFEAELFFREKGKYTVTCSAEGCQDIIVVVIE